MLLSMSLFHRHKWDLKDKTVIPPAVHELDLDGSEASGRGAVLRIATLMERMNLGYVVLTFTCACGDYRIEKR